MGWRMGATYRMARPNSPTSVMLPVLESEGASHEHSDDWNRSW
jgi:hypothetical protein